MWLLIVYYLQLFDIVSGIGDVSVDHHSAYVISASTLLGPVGPHSDVVAGIMVWIVAVVSRIASTVCLPVADNRFVSSFVCCQPALHGWTSSCSWSLCT